MQINTDIKLLLKHWQRNYRIFEPHDKPEFSVLFIGKVRYLKEVGKEHRVTHKRGV